MRPLSRETRIRALRSFGFTLSVPSEVVWTVLASMEVSGKETREVSFWAVLSRLLPIRRHKLPCRSGVIDDSGQRPRGFGPRESRSWRANRIEDLNELWKQA